MPDELEERLRSHAKSFDSLLSLIPAKLYYGEDVSDQWKRKKQTPEQKRAAKMAKLDPDNWKSAKDVMDERAAAAKRKRDDEESVEDRIVDPEQPKAVQDEENHKTKKRKTDGKDGALGKPQRSLDNMAAEERRRRKAESKAVKKEKKQKEKQNTNKQQKQQTQERQPKHDDSWVEVQDDNDKPGEESNADQDSRSSPHDIHMVDGASTASSSHPPSPIMSPPADSASSSISSIPASLSDQLVDPEVPKTTQKKSLQPLNQKVNQENSLQTTLDAAEKAAARERLSAAITTMRAQRKADSNPRSRQELLDQRRRKEEERRLAKKEQRRKEKEEATRKADEEIERRFSPGGSGSLLGSPRSPPVQADSVAGGGNAFSFGRIDLGNGTEFDSTNLSGILAKQKKKGPQDTNTALLAAKNKASRLSGLDEDKRKQIEEKDMWLNAKRRAHGERVKDDSSLLKKALKRQEGQKRKSEKEWTERKEGIQKSQEMRQKKRTENLNKRKEDKKHGSKGKKVKRPGFEGSFRGRTGGKKK